MSGHFEKSHGNSGESPLPVSGGGRGVGSSWRERSTTGPIAVRCRAENGNCHGGDAAIAPSGEEPRPYGHHDTAPTGNERGRCTAAVGAGTVYPRIAGAPRRPLPRARCAGGAAADRLSARERPERHARLAGTLRIGGRAPFRPSLATQYGDRCQFLPARLLHDEVQPEGERGRRRHAGLRGDPPVSAGRVHPGRAKDHARHAGVSGRDLRLRRGDALPGGGRARRVDRHPAHPGVSREPGRGRAAARRARAGQRARHESRHRRDERLQGRHGEVGRARQCRCRGTAGPRRAGHRRADDYQPEHARPLR